jgi:subtilisin family serine protease
MKKLLFFFGTALFACTANAQEAYWGKCNNTMLHLMKTHKQQARSAESKLLQRILVETTDASAVKQVVEAAGYKTLTIDESVIMVYIPLSYVPTLAAMEEVKHLASDSKADAKMELTHKLIGSDNVHKGVDLETPYTGKGVVVGVIDMGFQFQHASFLDENGKPRVHSVWNRVTKSEATTVIPKDGEIDDTAGHGTHVTSIAAGSHIESINVSGVAPEATIIMIPSDGFADNEVIEDIKYIKETAEALNMPHVINMSFGSHVGPHDGSTIHDYTLNKFSKSGSILVCAASNDGNDNIHTEHVFTADGEVRYVFFKDATAGFNRVEIWDQTADGKKHITVEPCYYSEKEQTVVVGKSNFTSTGFSIVDEVNSRNQKQNVTVFNYLNDLYKMSGDDSALFGLKITGDNGAHIHLWNRNSVNGQIYQPYVFKTAGIDRSMTLAGTKEYLIADAGGTAETTISVGSYNNGRGRWRALNGSEYQSTSSSISGQLSGFSSSGPSLTPNVMKPTIVAPGAYIRSAFNKYSSSYGSDRIDNYAFTTDKVTVKTPHPVIPGLTIDEDHFFGLMQGTSMSAPVVTGTIALWLEANPNLTYDQVIDIMKETAINDEFTAENGGTKAWGYGKLNAYKGLVKALEMANNTGVNNVINSEEPITLMKNNNEWNVLFNNNETFATIRICDLNGRIVSLRNITHPERGQEETISLSELPAGMYLINIKTTKANVTRKVMVQ